MADDRVHENQPKARYWCFTIFARAEEEHDWEFGHEEPIPFVGTYLVYQLERAPETHSLHLQGYVQFKQQCRMTTVKNKFHRPDMHLEIPHGTPQENKVYCTKEDSRIRGPWEHGEISTQGKRTDWAEVQAMVKAGNTDAEILERAPNFAAHARGIEFLRATFPQRPPIRRHIRVFYLYGTTGVGKTYRARMAFPDAYMVRGKYYDGKSFDDYSGEPALILDEWDPNEWPLTMMLTFLDEWTFRLQCRYHNKWAVWETVIITTNTPFEMAYYGCPQKAAFDRRVTHRTTIETREDIVSFEEEPTSP